MPEHRIAYLDCSMGLSEAMMLAALCDCGFDLDILKRALAPTSLHNYTIQLHPVRPGHQSGISGTRLTLVISEKEHTDIQTDQVRVGQSTPLPYADLADIEAIIQAIDTHSEVRERILALVQRLIAAQATVAGIDEAEMRWTAQEVTHTLVMLSGIVLACTELHITGLTASGLPMMYEDSETPAAMLASAVTMELLRQVSVPLRVSSLKGSTITPLAATIFAEMANFELPEMIVQRIGYGYTADEQHCLRLCIAQVSELADDSDMDTDRVVVIESNIDNMPGELLGALLERLLILGALDVNYTAIQMKKDRPATMLTVICKEGDEQRFARVLLRETTTLGVRIQPMRRFKAQRAQVRIETDLGPMLVKVKRLGTSFVSASPEYEECQRVAQSRSLPLIDVYEVARVAIRNAITQGIL
jgi:pyridinium-3,5-bisthiocarboxylic acid mononucleotide nickel chelatase